MLVVVQFPIGDGRCFVPTAARLPVPDFPEPRVGLYPQFLRYFGEARRRRKGGDAAWVDLSSFCLARRALRFPDLPLRRVGVDGAKLAPTGAFRRAFSDGVATARVEVGFRHDRRWEPLRGLDGRSLTAIVQGVLELPSEVDDLAGGPGTPKRRELVRQSLPLARLFEGATSPISREGLPAVRSGLVAEGRPLVVLEYEWEEVAELPPGAQIVDPARVRGADLAFAWTAWRLEPIPTWYVGPGTAEERDLRSLRLCLLRLNAGREALDVVMRLLRRDAIRFEPGTETGEELEWYLNEATRLISKERWSGISQSAILEAFDAAETIRELEENRLAERLDGMRREVRRKVEAFERARSAARTVFAPTYNVRGDIVESKVEISGGTVYGSVVGQVTAEKIQDSFNAFVGAGPREDLKAAMETLRKEVTELVEVMSRQGVGDPEEVAARFRVIADQAAKERPLREVIVAAAKGVVDAAREIADRAEPVVKAVTGVLKVLGIAAVL